MGHGDSLEDLHSLITLCPPPRNPGSYPSDHRELLNTYGAGCFDEFLWILTENAPTSNLDIIRQTEQMRSNFRHKALGTLRSVLNEHHATPEDLVQWGATDNADVLAWVAVGEPDSWPTVIIQAGQLDAVVFPAGSTTTLLGLLTGSLRVPFFPDDFPSRNPEFDVNPYR